MTYLQLINAVLIRLREDAVSTIDETTYSTLISKYVNEAKAEVEDSWDWSHLRTYVDITTVGGTDTYDLTGCDERTRFLDAYNITTKAELTQIGNNVTHNRYNALQTVSGSPREFDVVGYDTTDGELQVRLWPTPGAAETIRFYVVKPQAELSAAADVLKVPADPVIQGAYLRAIIERGEDQGNLSDRQAQNYTTSLSTHVAIDANKFVDEITWRPI